MLKIPGRLFPFVRNSALRLTDTPGQQLRTMLTVVFNIVLFGFGCSSAAVYAQEKPNVLVQVNAPGWITITWEHSGNSTSKYLLQRQDPPHTWEFLAHVNSYTDKGLNASTTYNYRVCAVDHNAAATCSPWISVTTMPPESSVSLSVPNVTPQEVTPDRIRISWSSTTRYGSFNVRWSEKGHRAGQENVRGGTSGSFEVPNLQPGRTYVFGVQGCNWGLFKSGCSGWGVVEIITTLPPTPPPTAPLVTASAPSERQIVLDWSVNEAERITQTVIERDGRPHHDRAEAINRFDDSVRPNTEYAYRVCLKNEIGTACSDTLKAMARPVVPSALADVAFTPSRFSGGPGGGLSGEGMKIRTALKASWRNTTTPGQFITLEREDRGPTGPMTVGRVWTEVKRISAKADPTEITTEVEAAGPRVGGVRIGHIYRVCTVVPVLGKAGNVCSAPSALSADSAALQTTGQKVGSQTTENIDLNALAARGEVIANQDPLAIELRNQQSGDPARRGFDIGMAAAEGQTMPGLGKQRIHDSLPAAEQAGYRSAVSFSLERNRYADRAVKGAAIAEADSIIAEARNSETDVFYKLGFDIATAIFGDPALGAQGNTQMGPGSQKIRDSLSVAGQRGFNASMELNIRRRTK